jgi:hypothetical protein
MSIRGPTSLLVLKQFKLEDKIVSVLTRKLRIDGVTGAAAGIVTGEARRNTLARNTARSNRLSALIHGEAFLVSRYRRG